jgi:hypothetical protein
MSLSLAQAALAAAQFLGVMDSGEALSSQQNLDALAAANNLLDNWTNEQVQLIKLAVQTFTLAGGTYTPGTVPQFPDVNTPITIPAGYTRALTLGLAIELAPQYGMQPSQALLKQYAEARAAAAPLTVRTIASAPQESAFGADRTRNE